MLLLSSYPRINTCNVKNITRKKFKKVVVLLSGGLDSSCLAYLTSKGCYHNKNKVFALTFDYGQRHKKELKGAIKIAKKIKAKEHKIVKIDLTLWGGSALTDRKIAVPQDRRLTASSIPVTYVPARNTIFLSFALSYAEAIGASEVYIGVNSVDYSGYIDCRKTFIDKFQKLANLATVTGVYGNGIKIKTPLINMSKKEIVKLGSKLGVDFSLTWSCYKGGKLACGVCDSCRLRLRGFKEAGIEDPLFYR